MFHRSIVEMQTGEGKTLTATLPMYLHALAGQGLPPGHGQRLSRPPRRRVDGADLRGPGHDRGRDRDADVAAAAAQGLRLRRHLRHGQGVRLRFPPRPAAAAADRRRADRPAGRHVGQGPGGRRREAGPGRALLRPGRRGRQHPDRRGPHAADHQRAADRGSSGWRWSATSGARRSSRSSSRTRTTSTTTRRRRSS